MLRTPEWFDNEVDALSGAHELLRTSGGKFQFEVVPNPTRPIEFRGMGDRSLGRRALVG
jgi:hypothetical protein